MLKNIIAAVICLGFHSRQLISDGLYVNCLCEHGIIQLKLITGILQQDGIILLQNFIDTVPNTLFYKY